MTPEPREELEICFPTKDVLASADTLIAASGMIEAIHHQYAAEGVLTTGALLYIATMIDQVIGKLGLDTLDMRQRDLPF